MSSKQEKKQKNYDKLTNIAESILNPDKIFFDLIEVVAYGRGIYGVKIYIENSGTYIVDCDEDDFKYFLEETKKEILANPYKCPFCGKLKPSSKCESCHAEFNQSNSYSGYEDNITSYNTFENFSKKIEEKTMVPSEVIKYFCDFDGKINDIFDGVAVIYKGNAKWPIFVNNQNIKLKNFNLIDDLSFHKLILSYLMVKNKNISQTNISENYRMFKSGSLIYNEKHKAEILAFFDSDLSYQTNEYISCLKLAIEGDPNYYIDFKSIKNNEEYEDDDEDDVDIFIDEMYGLGLQQDMIKHNYYFMFNFEFIDDKTLETNDFDTIVIEFENKINSMVDEAFIKSKKAIDNVIKKLKA